MGIRRILVVLLCAVLLSAGCARAEEIVFIREGAVWLSRPDGSGAHALTGAMDARSPALSPDGARVVFHSGRDEKTGFGTLSILRVADGTVAPLSFPDIAGAEDARFCPDGKSVIFVALRNPREKSVKGFDPMVFADMSVAVAQLSTGDVRHVIVRRNALLDAGHVFAAPCMSPDGLIAYQESVDDVPGGIVWSTTITLPRRRQLHFPKQERAGTIGQERSKRGFAPVSLTFCPPEAYLSLFHPLRSFS